MFYQALFQSSNPVLVVLHGGMGVSEELDIGHHYIRLNMIDRLFGDRDFHLSRYADLTQGTTA